MKLKKIKLKKINLKKMKQKLKKINNQITIAMIKSIILISRVKYSSLKKLKNNKLWRKWKRNQIK